MKVLFSAVVFTILALTTLPIIHSASKDLSFSGMKLLHGTNLRLNPVFPAKKRSPSPVKANKSTINYKASIPHFTERRPRALYSHTMLS